jgi:hypothetical protein
MEQAQISITGQITSHDTTSHKIQLKDKISRGEERGRLKFATNEITAEKGEQKWGGFKSFCSWERSSSW